MASGGESRNTQGSVYSINISKRHGIAKTPVKSCAVKKDFGILGDAHSGKGKRQVSILSWESIKKINNCPKIKNKDNTGNLGPGSFAENITTIGLDLNLVKIGDLIKMGSNVILRITKIGKECHRYCSIYLQIGDCIMPREGIFSEVITGGQVKTGDEVKVVMEN